MLAYLLIREGKAAALWRRMAAQLVPAVGTRQVWLRKSLFTELESPSGVWDMVAHII